MNDSLNDCPKRYLRKSIGNGGTVKSLSIAIDLETHQYIRDLAKTYGITMSHAGRMVLNKGMGRKDD